MANRWFREVRLGSTTNLSIPTLIKFWNLWLQKCCGYTFAAQLSTSGSFNTYEKTGTDGVFSGADFKLTDATAASFVAGDTGKWVLVTDPANPVNNGFYKATYVDASNLTIDFRSAATEYPTAATGLSWWLLAENYDVTATVNDYVRLQTPHVDGWQVELKYVNGGNTSKIAITLSVNGVWGAGQKILGPALYNLHYASTDAYNYIIANTEGTYFFAFEFTTGGGNLGCGWSRIVTEYETGHPAIEKWALFGPASISGTAASIYLTRHYDNWGYFRLWRDHYGVERRGYIQEISNNAYDSGFCYGSGEVNVRTSKNDVIYGSVLLVDTTNLYDEYECPGLVGGTYQVRKGLSARQAISQVATRDMFHTYDGILIDWPGVTPQY
jgi:hypothetical protein